MATIKSLSLGLGSIALAAMSPTLCIAETQQTAGLDGAASHSLVHRVSRSLAEADTYTSSGMSGYKWGQKSSQVDTGATNWAGSTRTRSSYKWGDSSTI